MDVVDDAPTPADGSPDTEALAAGGKVAIDNKGDEVLGATATERSGADVGPIPNPKRAPSEDDAPALPPRTGERRPPAVPVTPPRRPLSADGAAVYRYLSHVLELRRNSLTVEAADDAVSLSPPRTPSNKAALKE